MTKILSPVTSFRGATEVISSGADEIYCAVKIPGAVHLLNRPEFCCVPTYEELGRIADYAHLKGVETVVTLELPFLCRSIASRMKEHISSCVNEGIDALIVGDIGLIRMINDMGLGIPIYASTLLGALNYEAVDFIRKLCVKRVVLERLMSIKEIRHVVQCSKDVETEVFVHGQGCSNFNANCYLEFARAPMAAFQKVTSEIKGMTTPCQWQFDIYELDNGKRKTARVPILDAFTFCSLCRLPQLIETGVSGIKIVGRCMPLTYQVEATKMYRGLVNLVEQGQRRGFNRAQRRQLHRMIESLKDDPFQPQLQNPTGSRSASQPLRDVLCTEKRCYYSPLFHVPYKPSEP